MSDEAADQKDPPNGNPEETSSPPEPTAEPETTTPEFKYFLSLPPEVRVMIYDLVLKVPGKCYTPGRHPVSGEHCRPDLSLLSVNKQIRAEAAARFYSINTFEAWSSWPRDGKRPKYALFYLWIWTRERNRAHIRDFEYNIGIVYPKDIEHQVEFLAEILVVMPSLRRLVIRYNPDHFDPDKCPPREEVITRPYEDLLLSGLNAAIKHRLSGLEFVKLEEDFTIP